MQEPELFAMESDNLMKSVGTELRDFVETEILPRYDGFDRAHRRDHALEVIRLSLELAAQTNARADMAFAAAAYHDLGLEGPRETHHLLSGSILAADHRLRRWFSEAEIETMRQAAEDHRASAAKPPRNLYGRIVAEADRDLRPESVCRRTVEFGFAHYPELSREGHWQRFRQHLEEKYGPRGYLRLLFSPSPHDRNLASLRRLIAQSDRLRAVFDALYEKQLKINN